MLAKIVISELPPYFLDLDARTLSAFEVEIDGVKVWRVWCRFCVCWHDHGAGEGHRIAHCADPGSPYNREGYNLAYAGSYNAAKVEDSGKE
jgi:hypothetical protein